MHRKTYILHARGFCLELGQETKVMGILNLSPDSFSRDGLLVKTKKDLSRLTLRAQKLIDEGAHILDIGGESTRPGSNRISEKEEINRIGPAIGLLAKNLSVPISVDSYKTKVVQHALDGGASIVNNIMGTHPNKQLIKMIARYDAAVVLMHMRGRPKTMQKKIVYKDLIGEIIQELKNSLEIHLESGIKSDRIILDPGIGFGKTAEQNFEIIRRLKEFSSLNQPILMGTSRKSFIGAVTKKGVSNRLMGTAATVCASILNGAHIVRVHDVNELRDVVATSDSILNSNK